MHLHEESAAAPDAASQDKNGMLAMGALLADMNHEIRTTVNGVRGMLELLIDTGLTPSQEEYARTARHNVDSLLDSLERIVDMSLIESNSFRFNHARFDLLPEIRAALAGKAQSARCKGIELAIDYPSSVRLQGDAARLRGAFSAMADIALRCAAGETMSLACSTALLGESCRIVLEARVPQLSEDGARLASLLPATAARSLRDAAFHGKDLLGIAVCTRLVQMMQGTVTVDYSKPAAAVIRLAVELPLAGGQPDRLPVSETDAASSHAGCRVLVADDNPVNQQVAARMLEKLGCKADVAADGMQAIEMHTWNRFDLILMDCEMPVLDGLEATRRIRATEGPARRTPIIALTASTGQGEQERCLAAGMNDYLTKPIRPQMLADVLARWLPRPAPLPREESSAACEDELDEVKAMFGKDFGELAALYQRDGPPRLAALREAVTEGNFAKFAKVAHALGGSSASIGATGLSALCKAAETAAKSGPLEDIEKKLAAIETEYRRVCGKLQSLLAP